MDEFELARLATRPQKVIAKLCRTVVLIVGMYLVLHDFWHMEILHTRLMDLTLGELLGAIFFVVVACAAFGWLFVRLFKMPSDDLQTKDWCKGWTQLLFVPLALIGAAVFLIEYPPTGAPQLSGAAAAFLAEIVRMFY